MCIDQRLQEVRAAILRACAAADREAGAVTLIAVSKRQPLDAVVAAYDAGVRDFGENTAQELQSKATAMAATGRHPRWHFVGRLQSNKVAMILPHVSTIQSIDRLAVAEALDKRINDGRVDVLIQVNIGREPQKGGVDPDAALMLAATLAQRPHLRLCGLMAVPPAGVDARPYFQAMSKLFLQLRRMPYGGEVRELSMGMSGDYEVAIACGATMVRVGSAIFGERHRNEELA